MGEMFGGLMESDCKTKDFTVLSKAKFRVKSTRIVDISQVIYQMLEE